MWTVARVIVQTSRCTFCDTYMYIGTFLLSMTTNMLLQAFLKMSWKIGSLETQGQCSLLHGRLFSRPGWLPLVLQGWKICYKIDLYLPNSLQSRKLFSSFKTCGWTFSLKFVELIIVLINLVVWLNLWPEVKALGMSSSAACFLVDKICWPWSLALAFFIFFFTVFATLKTDFYKGI